MTEQRIGPDKEVTLHFALGLAGEIIARCEGKALELIRFRHPFY